MDGTPAETLFSDGSRPPLVRATRSQREVGYLPPYGDPEVSIPGEVATYVALGGLAATAIAHLGE